MPRKNRVYSGCRGSSLEQVQAREIRNMAIYLAFREGKVSNRELAKFHGLCKEQIRKFRTLYNQMEWEQYAPPGEHKIVPVVSWAWEPTKQHLMTGRTFDRVTRPRTLEWRGQTISLES